MEHPFYNYKNSKKIGLHFANHCIVFYLIIILSLIWKKKKNALSPSVFCCIYQLLQSTGNMKEATPVDSVATVNILLLPLTKDLFTLAYSWKQFLRIEETKLSCSIFLKSENIIGELYMKGDYRLMTPKRYLKKKVKVQKWLDTTRIIKVSKQMIWHQAFQWAP